MLRVIRFGLDVTRLRATHRWPASRIAALQRRRWRQLLKYASCHSAFYRERFRGIDLERCGPADLPTLTKAEMMAHFDELVTDRRVSRAGVERFISDPANLSRYYLGDYAVCHTSGSQGQPALVVQERRRLFLGIEAQLVRGTELDGFVSWYLNRLWKPVRFAVVTQKPGFYPTGAIFSHLGAMRSWFLKFLQLSVFDPVPELVSRLNDFQPEFIASYASALATLAREEKEGRLRLSRGKSLCQIINMRRHAEIEAQAPQQILEINSAEQVFRREAGDASKASAVVFGVLPRVREDGVGFGDFFESLLGAGLLVAIGMILESQLAEGVLDRLRVRVPPKTS